MRKDKSLPKSKWVIGRSRSAVTVVVGTTVTLILLRTCCRLAPAGKLEPAREPSVPQPRVDGMPSTQAGGTQPAREPSAPQSRVDDTPTEVNEQNTNVSKQETTTNQRYAKIQRLLPWCLIVASIALSGVAWAVHVDHPIVAGVLLIVALGLSSFLLQGPRLHYSRSVTYIASLLCAVQFLTAIGVGSSTFFSPDSKTLLQTTTLGVCGLGIALVVAVTWVPQCPFRGVRGGAYATSSDGRRGIIDRFVSVPGLSRCRAACAS